MNEQVVDADQSLRLQAANATAPGYSESVGYQRARLVVRCACDFLGLAEVPAVSELKVAVTVLEFQKLLERGYGSSHPNLVYRTDSTMERARLTRYPEWGLPKVVLRQGAPVRRDKVDARGGVRRPAPETRLTMPANSSLAMRR
jgi:hypothetical protein